MGIVRSDESVTVCTNCGNEQAGIGLAGRCVHCGEPLPQGQAAEPPPPARELRSDGTGLGPDRVFGGLTIALQWIFAAWAVFAAVGIAFRAIERSLLSRAAANRFSVSRAEALASDHRIDAFAYVAIAALIITGIIFIVWFHRAYRKTRQLGGEMRYTDGWAIGAWFIPIGSLWIPKKLANDIWWGTEASEDTGWQRRSALLTSWWLAWVFAGLSSRFFGNADDVDAGLRLNLLGMVHLALFLLAAVFALFVVRQIGERLDARSAAVAALVAAEPSPPTARATPPTSALPNDALAPRRRQPWLRVGATVAAVAIAVGTVAVVSGASGNRSHTTSKSVSTAPPVAPAPVPADFDRHESHSDGFAISVPNSWMSIDLTAPDIDRTLAQLKLTNPDITDYLDQQKQADVQLSFVAVDTSPQVLPAQLNMTRIPTGGESLDVGAREAAEVIKENSDVIGAVDRKRIDLPAGPAQVLTFKQRATTPLGERTWSKTEYLIVSGDYAYALALSVNDEQAAATAPVFDAVMQSLELRT